MFLKGLITMKYKKSANQKLAIMNGIFHNMECGVEMDRINPAFVELDGNHMLANPFLSTVIFELAIKSMWELSHSKVFGKAEIKDYGHSIHRIYPCLKGDFQDFISNEYEVEVRYFGDTLQDTLNSDQGEHYTEDQKEFILSCSYFTLEQCLKDNSKIIKNGKYKFQHQNKISVITGIIPNSVLNNDIVICCRQPSPFLKKITDYIETELNR